MQQAARISDLQPSLCWGSLLSSILRQDIHQTVKKNNRRLYNRQVRISSLKETLMERHFDEELQQVKEDL
jgi:hypothetical protein